jgi:hypothetical protein
METGGMPTAKRQARECMAIRVTTPSKHLHSSASRHSRSSGAWSYVALRGPMIARTARTKRKTLSRDFEELLAARDLDALKQVFDRCLLDATTGYSKHTALAFDACSTIVTHTRSATRQPDGGAPAQSGIAADLTLQDRDLMTEHHHLGHQSASARDSVGSQPRTRTALVYSTRLAPVVQ